jgi:cyanophycin synthetase
MWAHEIPATLEGHARFNIYNAMAAVAIGYALRVSVETIRQAMGSFVTSFFQNPGRLNIYDEHGFRVILDYGHNPDALQNISAMVREMRPRYKRVIAMLGGTGDRRDEDILELGELAGGMVDELIVKDALLRGRKSGEAAELIREGAQRAGLPKERIRLVLPELEAVVTTLETAQPGDLVFIFADEINDVWQQITSFKAHQPSSRSS